MNVYFESEQQFQARMAAVERHRSQTCGAAAIASLIKERDDLRYWNAELRREIEKAQARIKELEKKLDWPYDWTQF